jgi:hypothetical protein
VDGVLVALDSFREEIVVRAAEYVRREARRHGDERELGELWPGELRDLAHERGWLTDGAPAPAGLRARRDQLAEERRRAPHPVLAALARHAGLSPAAVQLVASCAVAQLDPAILRLWRVLAPIPGATAFPLGTWLELFADERAELLAALDPHAPLRRLRLLEVRASGPSLLTAEVEVPGRVVAALLGRTGALDGVPPRAVRIATTLDEAELVLPAMYPIVPRDATRIVFAGAVGAGRASRARAWAHDAWPATVLIDLADEPREPRDPRDVRGAALVTTLGLREALLAGALPIVRLDRLRPTDRAIDDVLDMLDRHEAPLAIVAPEGLVGALVERVARLTVIDVPRMALSDQERMWDAELARRGLAAGQLAPGQLAPGQLASRIVASYDMLPGGIASVVRRLPGDAAVDLGAIQAAVRTATTTELWGLASRVTTTLDWSDVTFADTTRDLLTELVAHARHRVTVFEDWGYQRKISYGRALTALFYGAPGTGKTLAAGLVAADLGRDLFRVDLSRIVDKYVGETEKNLDRIFAEAQRSHAMLLFDEADSLFAKRTSVESANDRYANLAVNYLLQALEAFDGICILTTNMDGSIDEAFRRRMRFRIEFPKPSVAEQAALWRGMITPQAKVAADVPWLAIAEQFPEMTGGHIRSAVLRAAFLAVAEGGIIDVDRIRRAAHAEYEELGHIITSGAKRSRL